MERLEMVKEIKVRGHPEEGLREMEKDSNLEKRIGVQVDQLNFLIIEKFMEEVAQEPQSQLEMLVEDD